VQPRLATVLCLASSSHKRPGPLMRQTSRLLVDLARSLPQGVAAHSRPG
jgi:LysR family nitrogen assimilation transcriptional regulator